ncbi:MAG TPA: phage holin family protein [Candidatus Dormibacteraeota bacterium]|nr:phage holin family protein [Candidatus Dormibacteraeota bacterium]
MWGLLVSWGLLAIAFFLTTKVVPGIQVKGGVPAYVLAALVFGLVNAILGPILRIAALPLRILTLGLFALVINAVLLVIASKLFSGLSIDNFLSAILGGLVLSIISALLNAFGSPVLRRAVR